MEVDDFSPIAVGDTGAPFAVAFTTLNTAGVTVPYPLSGISINMKMLSEDGQTTKTCVGTWTIDSASSGLAHYSFQAQDVDTPGVWTMYITLTVGGLPLHTEKKTLEIETAP